MPKKTHKNRGISIGDNDIDIALSVLKGQTTLLRLREKRHLTTSSCYSYLFRSLRLALEKNRIRIVFPNK